MDAPAWAELHSLQSCLKAQTSFLSGTWRLDSFWCAWQNFALHTAHITGNGVLWMNYMEGYWPIYVCRDWCWFSSWIRAIINKLLLLLCNNSNKYKENTENLNGNDRLSAAHSFILLRIIYLFGVVLLKKGVGIGFCKIGLSNLKTQLLESSISLPTTNRFVSPSGCYILCN